MSTDAALPYSISAAIESVRAVDNASLDDLVPRRQGLEAEAFTDALGCFRRVDVAGHERSALHSGGGRVATKADDARWVIVLLSNLKRALDGAYPPTSS